jgi:hypothetical protein
MIATNPDAICRRAAELLAGLVRQELPGDTQVGADRGFFKV